MRWFFKKALKASGIVYVVCLLFVFFAQRQFMYFPPPEYVTPDAAGLTGFEEVTLDTSHGDTVKGWWSVPAETHPIVMHFHGNGSAIYSNSVIYTELSEMGLGVWAVGYPGYPGSSGSSSEASLVSAALAQYDFLIEQGYTSEHIVLYGTSLGTAVATQVAARRSVKGIVLEAPFNAMTDMVRIRMPIFAFSFLIKDKYESDTALAAQSAPVLWLHAPRDYVVPLSQGQKLYDGYNGSKDFLIIEDGNHFNLWAKGGNEKIPQFIRWLYTGQSDEGVSPNK